MRKLILALCLGFVCIAGNAQIYTQVTYYDKFDDALITEQRKTLITKTDSTFVIEEKGKNPVVYYILNMVPAGTEGSKDEVVNLVSDVYGYQTTWCIVRSDLYKDYLEAYSKWILDPSDENMKVVQPFWLFAIHRTITTQYTASYITEYFWIQDEYNSDILGKNVNRIVYSMR